MSEGALERLAAWPRWRSQGLPRQRRMVRLRPTEEEAATLLTWVSEVADASVAAEVAPELGEAARRLTALSPGARLGDDGTAEAARALEDLVARLEGVSTLEDPAVARLVAALRGEGAPIQEVARAMRDFARDLYRREGAENFARGAAPSFSLILVRSSDHGGAVERSLHTRTGQWRRALAPADPKTVDRHAAVIPPPGAEVAINALADQLGLEPLDLPGVAFLGPVDRTDPAAFVERLAPSIWTEWAFLRLDPEGRGGSYPEQLARIYRGVYAHGAIWGGDPRGVIADRAVKKLRASVKPRSLARLLLTSLGGASWGEVFDLVDRLRASAEDG